MTHIDPLANVSPRVALVIAILLVALTAWADYLVGFDVDLTLFYMAPVVLVGWVAGLMCGLVVALLSVVSELIVHHQIELPPLKLVAAWNIGVQFGVLAAAAWLLARFHRLLEREAYLAQTDALTGLANRRAFYIATAREIERLRRHGRSLTLVMIDLDDFKKINDKQGHAAGDELLRRVARVLSERMRSVDLAARLGGDEFALLLPETRQEDAERLSADLLQRLSPALRVPSGRGGVSLGAVTFETAPGGVDDALRAADERLYEAKHRGKGRACHATYVVPVVPCDQPGHRRRA